MSIDDGASEFFNSPEKDRIIGAQIGIQRLDQWFCEASGEVSEAMKPEFEDYWWVVGIAVHLYLADLKEHFLQTRGETFSEWTRWFTPQEFAENFWTHPDIESYFIRAENYEPDETLIDKFVEAYL